MTTLDIPPKEVLKTYRSRDAVARGFRITKETIKIRPIWNRTKQHIKAHLLICFIAYLLYSLLELQVRERIPGITGVKALDKLKIMTKLAKRDIDTSEGKEILSTMVEKRA